jgi:prophage antirepressor-like protein
MENSIVVFSGVRGYEKDGVAHLHIEDVARGLGFTEKKDGVEYVRWRTVDSYLSNLAFATCCENGNPHDYYIPENIFYRLCMKAKNSVAEAFQAKVADEIIPSIRKTGKYELNSGNDLPKTYLEALKALVSKEEERIALEEEKKILEAERDEAIHTKTQYQEGLAAQMSGRVGGLVKANNVLREENSELKDAVGRGANWRTVSMMKSEWIREFGHAPVWQKLKQFSKDVCIEPIKDVEEKVVLADGSEKTRICFRYHREAWARYRKYEENLRVGDMEIMSI